jgi:hypothetical protein
MARHFPLFALGLFLMFVRPTMVRAADTVTTPFPGGRLTHTVSDTQDWWVLAIDVCAPGVSFAVTAESERGRTVPSFASLVGATAAINGDFGDRGPPFLTDGPAMHDGARWGGVDHGYVSPIAFGPAHIDFPPMGLVSESLPAWAREVVSGHPTLLDDGIVVGNPEDSLCTVRHPRTAMGISADRRSLFWLVADGRRPGAAGLTCDEMAFILASYGAVDAVNMDGGGSSTLVVHDEVKNQPSDGSPRVVSNHLAVFATGTGPSPFCPDFIDPACDGERNQQRCDGTVVTSCDNGAPVLNGDCGFFGAGCSTEGGVAHCVHPYCMAELDGSETGAFCKDDTNILGTCNLGLYQEGDCSFFGATCSEAGGEGHCVHPYCPANLGGAEDGSFCTEAGGRASCTLGHYVEEDCGVEPCVELSATLARCGGLARDDGAASDDAASDDAASDDAASDDAASDDAASDDAASDDAASSEDDGSPDVSRAATAEARPAAFPRSVRPSCAQTSPSWLSWMSLSAMLTLRLRRRRRCRVSEDVARPTSAEAFRWAG